jgi:tungstate transport system substrate-binding protein
LTLATTTSVGNSGLLEPLALAFLRQHRIELRSHLAGSGRALELLASGNADVVISHAPGLEAKALRRHPEWRYQKIMFNDFVLVAPRHDPAQVKNARDIGEAMRRIASSPTARFLSRGDRSGTHEREETLWAAAGRRPSPDRLVIGGAGMGATLRMASETGAYTLTDRATFAQLASRLSLVVVFEGGELLLNTYAVIVPSSGPFQVEATAFADWLSDGKGRDVIDQFRIASDLRAFSVWPLESPRHDPAAVPPWLD